MISVMLSNITYRVIAGQGEKHNSAHDRCVSIGHVCAMSETSGPFFAKWRQFRGMTQQQAAEATGIQQGLLSALERGTRRFNQDHLADMALGYDCEAWQLLGQDPFDPGPIPEALEVLEAIPEDRQRLAIKTLKAFIEDSGT